jgi:hypothetical protein
MLYFNQLAKKRTKRGTTIVRGVTIIISVSKTDKMHSMKQQEWRRKSPI